MTGWNFSNNLGPRPYDQIHKDIRKPAIVNKAYNSVGDHIGGYLA